jgi:methanogenic corrinoid protein MtbC1
MNSRIDEAAYQQYLSALLEGNRTQCAKTLTELMAAGADLKDLYVKLFQRALYQVGELWENQRISVAVEHLATAITERMLTLVQAQTLAGPARNRSIVIACVADEYHQLGGRMIADFCEMRGWRGYFLGASTSLADLLKTIEERRPSMLGLSLSLYLSLPALLKAVAAVTERFPELPILVGGQALRWGELDELLAYPQVSCIASLDELEQKLAAYEE